MKKIILAAFLGGTLGIVSAVKLTGPVLAENNSDKANVYEQLDLFGDIFDRIRSEYVEEVDAKELIEAAINGMLTSLDPHSSYLPPVDAEKMREQTRGEFGGLGKIVYFLICPACHSILSPQFPYNLISLFDF